MFPAVYSALFSTVALAVTTACFVLGGLPLLVFKRASSLDASVIRGFFNIYDKAAFCAAVGASLSLVIVGLSYFAVGAPAL